MNYAAHADAAEGLISEIIGAGGHAIAALADVGDAAAIAAVVACTEEELGPLTILMNNAGVFVAGYARRLRPPLARSAPTTMRPLLS